MTYTAGEVAKKLGMTKDGLRYYEREGLLPPIKRDKSGHRAYTEGDVEWIFLIRCLRDTDMPIFKIKQYISFLMEGGQNSVPERRAILIEHQTNIIEKLATYQMLLQLIEKKVSFYDEVLDDNNLDAKCVDYADEWAHFRAILGGIKHD